MTDLVEFYGEPISVYTRAQALRDGVLVDVSKGQRLFKFPVAVTARVWAECIAWEEDSMQAIQDQTGRLSDVLWMTFCAIRRANECAPTDRVEVELYVIPRDGVSTEPERVELVAVCGPGDDMEPVITIQFPGED